MKKLILENPPDSGGKVYVRGNDFHHLARVRRVRPGSVIDAILPDGTGTSLTVLSVDNDVLIAGRDCGSDSAPAQNFSLPPIFLFQALPKGLKMDLIVRQAAEGGVREIVPFVSENSQVKINASGPEKKLRWERIIREARQQSGSSVPTSVRDPCGTGALLDYWDKLRREIPTGVGILLHQNPLEPGSFHDYLGNNPGFAAMLTGPEGGFSPAEVGRFLAAGFRPVVIGDTVLRTETAALYGAAAIRVILMENSSWQLRKNRPLSPGDASVS